MVSPCHECLCFWWAFQMDFIHHFSYVRWRCCSIRGTRLCHNFFHLLAQKPNLETFSIYSNKFLNNFHLSESSLTFPGLWCKWVSTKTGTFRTSLWLFHDHILLQIQISSVSDRIILQLISYFDYTFLVLWCELCYDFWAKRC